MRIHVDVPTKDSGPKFCLAGPYTTVLFRGAVDEEHVLMGSPSVTHLCEDDLTRSNGRLDDSPARERKLDGRATLFQYGGRRSIR